MKLLVPFTVLVLLAAGVSAQEPTVTAEMDFTGISVPIPVKLPVPAYPKEARKADLGGRVSVAVSIDERGKATVADVAIGPYPVCQAVTDPKVVSLRLAALAAAKRATFKPAVLLSEPIWTGGHIVYTFSLAPKAPRPPDKFGVQLLGQIDDTGGAALANPDGKRTGLAPGGVLNGKALELPKPSYPRAARAVRAGGQVAVRVLIYEDGTIFSAEAINGHPLLKTESETAACGAKFTPTLLSGQPVKVSGVITYNYVP